MRLGSQARSFGEGIYASEEEFLSVVREAGEVGLEGIESNWKNMERYFDAPDEFKRKLVEADLELIGAHYGGKFADESTRHQTLSDLKRIAPFLAVVEGSFVVCSGHAPKGEPVTQDTWEKTAERLHEFADICAPEGVTVAYHNHWWESEAGGIAGLAALTDASKVGFAFDTGHHTRAGCDAAQTIRELGSRLALVHLADHAPDADGAALRPPLGEGRLDMTAVKAALREVGFNDWLVLEEQTERATARKQVRRCVELLRRFRE